MIKILTDSEIETIKGGDSSSDYNSRLPTVTLAVIIAAAVMSIPIAVGGITFCMWRIRKISASRNAVYNSGIRDVIANSILSIMAAGVGVKSQSTVPLDKLV